MPKRLLTLFILLFSLGTAACGQGGHAGGTVKSQSAGTGCGSG